jgi:hypothetical protein
MAPKAFLFAPPEYWRLSEDERKAFRCGPGRGVLEWLVPENIVGCSVSAACSVHDFMYAHGITATDKCEADAVFLNNMIRLIEAAGGPWLLRRLRLRRARIYYEAVSHFGGPAFWNQKNRPNEIGLV